MIDVKLFFLTGLFVFGLLFSQVATAQPNYMPGYIINNNTDTVFGYIDYRNWNNTPESIRFKQSLEMTPTEYLPGEIQSFWVADKNFTSATLNTALYPTRTNDLENNPDIVITELTVFVQTLISGEKSLYSYSNSSGSINFYIKNNGTFELLLHKKYTLFRLNKRRVFENKTYLSQLASYLSECPDIYSVLEKTTYQQKSLLKLFEYYYTCNPTSEIAYQIQKERVTLEAGLLAGISITSLSFAGDYLSYLYDAEFDRSVNLSGGLYLEIVLPWILRNWSINNEVLYSKYKINAYHERFTNNSDYSNTASEFEYSYLKIYNTFRYRYHLGSSSIFLNGGISYGLALTESQNRYTEYHFYGNDHSIEAPALLLTRKNETGYIIGAGAKYDKLSIEIRLEKASGMSPYPRLASNVTRYFVLLGYQF